MNRLTEVFKSSETNISQSNLKVINNILDTAFQDEYFDKEIQNLGSEDFN